MDIQYLVTNLDFFSLPDIVNVYLQNTLRIAKGKKMPSAEEIKNVVRMGIVTDQINLVRVLGRWSIMGKSCYRSL